MGPGGCRLDAWGCTLGACGLQAGFLGPQAGGMGLAGRVRLAAGLVHVAVGWERGAHIVAIAVAGGALGGLAHLSHCDLALKFATVIKEYSRCALGGPSQIALACDCTHTASGQCPRGMQRARAGGCVRWGGEGDHTQILAASDPFRQPSSEVSAANPVGVLDSRTCV